MDSQNAITSKSLLSITDSDLENVTQRSTYKSVKGFPFLDLQTMCEKQLLPVYNKNQDMTNDVLSTLIFINQFLPEIRNTIISHLFDQHGQYVVKIFMEKPFAHVLYSYAAIKEDGFASAASFIKKFTYAKPELRNFFVCYEEKLTNAIAFLNTKKYKSTIDITRYVSNTPLEIQTCPVKYRYKCNDKQYPETRKGCITISSVSGLLGRTDVTISGPIVPINPSLSTNSTNSEQCIYTSAYYVKERKIINEFGDHDTFVQLSIENGSFFGLFSGHDGEQAPNLLEKYFHILFHNAVGTIKERITAACMQMNEAKIDANKTFYTGLESGSSLGIVFVKDDIVHCAHIGICRVFIKNQNGIICLTQDHTGKNEKEVTRIAETNKHTRRETSFSDNSKYYAKYVYREYGVVTYVTRSIGDSNVSQLNITPEPEYCECTLDENQYIIITSNNARQDDIPSVEEEALALEKLFQDNSNTTIEELPKKFSESWNTNRAIMIINMQKQGTIKAFDAEKEKSQLEPSPKSIEQKLNLRPVPIKKSEEDNPIVFNYTILWSKVKQWITPTLAYTLGTCSIIAALYYLITHYSFDSQNIFTK